MGEERGGTLRSGLLLLILLTAVRAAHGQEAPNREAAQTTPAQAETVPGAAAQTTPAQTEPVPRAAAQATPAQTAPVPGAAAQATPVQTEPVPGAAAQATPVQTEPVPGAAAQAMPAQTEPVPGAAAQTTPAQTEPVQTAPTERTSVQASSGAPAPAQTAPTESVPAQAASSATVVQAAPVQATQIKTAPVQATSTTTPPPRVTREQAKETYDRIAAQVAAGDESVDWTALRFAAAQAKSYGKFDESEAQARMFSELTAKRHSTALYEAQQILKRNIANGNAHYVAMSAYDHLEDAAHFEAEEKLVKALSGSIFGTQTGRSIDSAWVIVSDDEEYFVLQVLGMQAKSQSPAKKGGKIYRQVHAVDEQSEQAVRALTQVAGEVAGKQSRASGGQGAGEQNQAAAGGLNSDSEVDLWFDTTFSMQQLSAPAGHRRHRK